MIRFSLLLLLVSTITFAQNRPLLHEDDASRYCDDVMTLLENGNFDSALAHLNKALSSTVTVSLDKDLQSFLDNAATKYGRAIGTEQVKSDHLGTSIVRYTYLLQLQRHPVWLQFTYYKGDQNYTLIHVGWGDDVSALF